MQMTQKYLEIVAQLLSIAVVIAAGGLWSSAGVETRPKYRDEQTLVGGTIWSQIIIPIGLIISGIVDETLDKFIHGYFILSGVVFLLGTGLILVIREAKIRKRQRSPQQAHVSHRPRRSRSMPAEKWDKLYFSIGVLCLISAVLKICSFTIMLLSKNNEPEHRPTRF